MIEHLYLLWKDYWGFIIFLIILLVVNLCFALLLRRHYEKKYEKKSDFLSALIDGEGMIDLSDTKETLPSKTYHQLMRLQSILRESTKKANLERDNIQRLITEIAHQLRTPLLNIKLYTDLLDNPKLPRNEHDQYLNAVLQSEEKLSFLVESFIKMSRLENQLIQIHPDSCNLKETILNAIFQLRHKAENKKISIEFRQSNMIATKHDSNWLGEAIYNIIDNSVKYSPIESRIIISIHKNEMFTQITVRDYGIGIEEGEEANIFQRFYRGKKATKEEGFGIGLYLSREIILAHGGFIKVKRKDPGLQVTIYLS